MHGQTHRRTRRRTYALAATTVATATATTAALALTLAPAATASPLTEPAPQPTPVTSDFNGDGYADLAVGVPDATVSGKAKAGYVNLVWGGAKGLGRYGSIRVSQATAEVPGAPEKGDRFGASVALADLNGDGDAELIIGAPGEDVDGRGTDAGAVTVVGGAKHGTGPGSTALTGPSAQSAYGWSVAATDLTGDNQRDLVVGGRDKVVLRAVVDNGEDVVTTTVVAAPMGGRAPLLATGDFTADGTDDLALAYYTINAPSTRSHVRLWSWNETERRMDNTWNSDNSAASALAVGDFDGDGLDDLALGECREIADENIDDPCGPESYAKGGAIDIEYGDKNGSFGYRSQTLNQDTVGVYGVAEDGDRFGASLAVLDWNRDGRDDLIAGAPGEAIGTRTAAGAATLLLGHAGGIVDKFGEATSVQYHQDRPRVPGVAETNDAFGTAVATGDYDNDGTPDTAVGAPGENARSGGVWVFPKTSVTNSRALTPKNLGLPSPTTALSYGKYLSSH
ncbi:FG-GAP-like repeat-containing protein [Streptomyces europaeiscabiei]|uniref:FG-GAP-like repeat-containing protein n=1 Tax=Streptomyces europaeiscabiei TaxID=146819 RepID=A0AAJ2UP47_9ACTN|nr:FG-GAP-like repeat-containing protein [Streptomyces europaeiscabiei]MDX3134263.1 FG-GAP-like repeat-containing protein [Streptomyces europaeiscabiei]